MLKLLKEHHEINFYKIMGFSCCSLQETVSSKHPGTYHMLLQPIRNYKPTEACLVISKSAFIHLNATIS